MKGNRPHSLIGKFSRLLTTGGNRTGLSDVLPIPKTPSNSKTRYPRCAGQFDPGAVGLGIVVMLGKSSAKHNALFRPVDLNPTRGKFDGTCRQARDVDSSEENYNYVTFAERSVAQVYYDGNEDNVVFGRVGRSRDDISRRPSPTRRRTGEDVTSVGVVNVLPSLEFLSSCDLCGKNLRGRDVYMYRGEKAFCSTDCRSNHMMNDERKDLNCRSETPKAVDFSPRSPYTNDQIFSAGILAI